MFASCNTTTCSVSCVTSFLYLYLLTSDCQFCVKHTWSHPILTLVLLNRDIPCLCKQCKNRSVGFWKSQLIWICTVCRKVCEYVSTTWIMSSDWQKIRSGHGILIFSAGQGLRRAILIGQFSSIQCHPFLKICHFLLNHCASFYQISQESSLVGTNWKFLACLYIQGWWYVAWKNRVICLWCSTSLVQNSCPSYVF